MLMCPTVPADMWLWGELRRHLEAEALTLGKPNLLRSGGAGDPCSGGSHVFAQFLEGCETPGLDRAQGSSLMGEEKAGEAGT